MDDAFFISREAQYTAADLQAGNSLNAANRLREDCAHMAPEEFASLLRQTKADEGPNCLSDFTVYGNGAVGVRSQDGSVCPAGALPNFEMAHVLEPPPPPCPPAFSVGVHVGGPVFIPDPHRMWVPPDHRFAPHPVGGLDINVKIP